ncbi:DNA topology modulation protein [Paenibacillus sp. SC116]|uniref:DNA topology modulation protein n=1 Tax=Paenibacillus sp. SC116 TaxID=2968986 RepID=UPI00215AA6AB|nr:DNA topology modulation protein [Paenibacillus sp. SC116]MCR8846494.1 DNA topology modulation protein [Paenibacillus sp. SC116]
MKIMIIGSAGSGKSTFATKLSAITKLPVYHLDAYYWRPSWVATPNEEWDLFMNNLVEEESWIIDGNYSRTLDIRIKEADVILFFDLPPILNTYRVIKRRIQYDGKTRPDMNEGCDEKLDWAFIKWVWNFRRNSKPVIEQKLAEYGREKKIIIFRKLSDSAKVLKEIEKNGIEGLL